MGAQSPPNFPVIDLSNENLKPGTSSWFKTCNNVRLALEEYGCFEALYDHKMSQQLHQEIFSELKNLFDLPTEIKMKNVSDHPFFGYVGHHPSIPPIHEGLGIGNATTLEAAQSFTNLMWPQGNDHFCETVLSYAKIVSELEQVVASMVFESYGVEKYYDTHVKSTTYLFRSMKYRVPEKNESNIAVNVHTDKSFLTILHQNEVKGLEFKTVNGHWIQFEPSRPSSFAVNAGDAFLAWSNGRIHSAPHRVMMRGSQPRYSVGIFSYHSGTIEIPEELVDEEHPLQFKPFDHYGLLNYFATAEGPKIESSAKAYCGV
ncbi:hypothetical protein UlMin_016314 [Ulmus minor]